MNYLKELRLRKGLTQERLSQLLNVSQQAITKWESGECLPRADKLPRLAEILGCTVDELLREPDQAI